MQEDGSSEDYYLVAHKVFGHRCLDIACPMEMKDGIWWIMPLNGHRLYPYWTYKLSELFAWTNIGDPPPELRDHYSTAETKSVRQNTKPIVPNLEDI